MLPTTPEQGWEMFMAAINAEDMDAALALYEDGAVMASPQGDPAAGKDGVRSQLERLLAISAKIEGRIAKLFAANDVALMFVEWTATGIGPSGNKIRLGGVSTDVSRRQQDGTWMMVIDNPMGTAIVASEKSTST